MSFASQRSGKTSSRGHIQLGVAVISVQSSIPKLPRNSAKVIRSCGNVLGHAPDLQSQYKTGGRSVPGMPAENPRRQAYFGRSCSERHPLSSFRVHGTHWNLSPDSRTTYHLHGLCERPGHLSLLTWCYAVLVSAKLPQQLLASQQHSLQQRPHCFDQQSASVNRHFPRFSLAKPC